MGTIKDINNSDADTWISDMHLFVAVAKAQSFTQAAKHLGIPHSTLSRRVSGLEAALGLRLLNRTTRQVEVTEDGMEYLERAERVVADALAIHEELRFRRGKPAGLLRISIPECIALQLATPWIAEFTEAHPDVRLQIDTAPEHADPIRDGFDICICHTQVRDSSYIKRTIATFKRTLFASPSYAKAHGLPQTPEELAHHQCIFMSDSRLPTAAWTLHRDAEERVVEVTGRVATLSQMLAPELAKEGIGIAPGMPGPLQPDVDGGRLVHVLPDWRLTPLEVSIVTPDKLVPARSRAFIEFFSAKYKRFALSQE